MLSKQIWPQNRAGVMDGKEKNKGLLGDAGALPAGIFENVN